MRALTEKSVRGRGAVGRSRGGPAHRPGPGQGRCQVPLESLDANLLKSFLMDFYFLKKNSLFFFVKSEYLEKIKLTN